MRIFRLLPVLLVLAATHALAQAPGSGSLSEGAIRSGAPKAPRVVTKNEAPPPAVPGARARPDSVAPANPSAADLPPTEALFDAINRGDIVGVRDAVSRGADLDGTNLLGLTPLELSVDLGRNDISFLLLSLRQPGDSPRGAPPVQQAGTAPQPTAAERRRAQQDAQAQARLAKKEQQAPAAAAAPSRAPALFAGNGGTPVPQAGFLGFDPKH